MPRTRHSVASKRRKNKVYKQAKGYFGARSRLFRTAQEAVNRAQAYAYRDRRNRKRDFRRLWIARINAAARLNGVSYSQLICPAPPPEGARVTTRPAAPVGRALSIFAPRPRPSRLSTAGFPGALRGRCRPHSIRGRRAVVLPVAEPDAGQDHARRNRKP